MGWMIDGKIALDAICEREQWHRRSVIDALVGEGLTLAEAEAYTSFAFADHATVSDDRPEDLVSEEQWERLTLSKN